MRDVLKYHVLERVSDSTVRWTLSELIRVLTRSFPSERKQIKRVIRQLVDTGELAYTYEHGCSFIEPSFAGPVTLSKRVTVKPPNIRYEAGPDEVVVDLHPGASFGNGRHPTTRLAVQRLDDIFSEDTTACVGKMKDVLDIGSGSGILLITALHLGVEKGVGIDTDPCARAETMQNIHANGFSARGEVADGDLSTFQKPFSLVTANLRYPSLLKLSKKIAALTAPDGFIVLSGIKTEEIDGVKNAYRKIGLIPVLERFEKGWAAGVFQKHCYRKHVPK